MLKPEIVIVQDFEEFVKGLAKIGQLFDNKAESPMAIPNISSEFCDNFNQLEEFAKSTLLHMIQNTPESCPQIHFLSRSGLIAGLILVTMPQDRRQQTLLAAGISFLLKRAKIDAMSFAAEIWYATERKGHESGTSPSQRSDRKEGAFVSVSNRVDHRASIHDLIRGSRGDVIGLESGIAGQAYGHFSELNPVFGNLFTFYDQLKATVGDAGWPSVH